MSKIGLSVMFAVIFVSVCAAWLIAAPSVGPVAAAPAYIVVNTPTAVTFTAQISDPTVMPTGVNLIRTDAGGKPLGVVGVLRDDGTNGDLLAGDQIFTIRLNLTEPTSGRAFFRTSAAFRRVLQRVQSTIVSVTIDPIPLPPDPGETGRQTLAGVDTDGDGLRDDVQRYIHLTHGSSPRVAMALVDAAIALQHFSTAGPVSQPVFAIQEVNAVRCLTYLTDVSSADRTFTDLRGRVLNTPQRSSQYTVALNALPELDLGTPRRSDLGQSCSV